MSYPARTGTAGLYQPLSRPTAGRNPTSTRTAAAASKKKKRSKIPSEPPPKVVRNSTTGTSYKVGSMLGKGGFARVYKFTDMTTGVTYAGKVVAKSSITKARARAKLKSEIELHRSLDHAHVVDFVQFFEDSKFVYILLELADNGSFMDLLKTRRQLTEPEVAYYMLQLLDAIEYMHSKNIIHRDLKLGNLFLDGNMHVQVGDFGLAAVMDADGKPRRTLCGTPNYLAPEILDTRGKGHGFEVDVWSSGVILYTMIIGKPPFETSKLKTTYNLIKTNTYSFPPDKPISEAARSLIRAMLQARPSARPTIAEIKAHRFFTEHSVPSSLPRSALKRAPLPSELFAGPDGVSASSRSSKASSVLESASNVPSSSRSSSSAASKYKSDKYTEALKAKYAGKRVSVTASASAGTKPSSASTRVAGMAPASSGRSAKPEDDDCGNLNMMHEKLTKSFAIMNSGKSARTAAADLGDGAAVPGEPAKWVIKWVDYSNKYGLGYQLSDGTIGVYFNDSTKIVLSSNDLNVDYIERLRSSAGSRDLAQSITMSEYPESLNKKMTLLTYFKNYLMEHLERAAKDGESSSSSNTRASSPGISAVNVPSPEDAPKAGMVYVKKWLRTKHAIIFRLSDKTVQVNFFDHTKIILSSEAQLVTYVDKQRKTSTHTLQAIMADQSPELINRLKYAKDILFHLISKNKPSKRTS